MRRLGLEKLWPGKRTLEPRQKKGKESVEEKLERKVGLLKKPWERLEMGGQAPPAGLATDALQSATLGHVVALDPARTPGVPPGMPCAMPAPFAAGLCPPASIREGPLATARARRGPGRAGRRHGTEMAVLVGHV